MSEIVPAFPWREIIKMSADSVPECFLGAGGGFSEQFLQLGKEVLDRVEIGGGGRKVKQAGPRGPDRLAHAGYFGWAQVVHAHRITWLQLRREHLLDVGAERLARHGAIQHEGRDDPARPQASAEGRRAPMAMGDRIDQAPAPGTPAIPAA